MVAYIYNGTPITRAQFGEYLLPYTDVRTPPDPEATLLAFFQNTYEAAATLGAWDRAALEAHNPTRHSVPR